MLYSDMHETRMIKLSEPSSYVTLISPNPNTTPEKILWD